MKHLFIWLIKLYRKCISPLKPPCCRFYPTCSSYALEAFQNRGFFVALFLSVKRIFRCNPFSRGGYDPVPLKGARRAPKSVIQSKIESGKCTPKQEMDETNVKNEL
ncbi:MAG: membrane protein insertion efficiency factor YidD [Clostridia bacterium]|nr:membrane protein insertion efficiency factor YidD [Clostridia bacterium]